MDLGYQEDNFACVAPKEMEAYSLFEANQVLREGRPRTCQGVSWKRD